MSRYKELCQTFPMKEIIQESTRITSTIPFLLDQCWLENITKRCDRCKTFGPSIDILHTKSFKDQVKYA